jgi:hypothetical protein
MKHTTMHHVLVVNHSDDPLLFLQNISEISANVEILVVEVR